MAERVLRHKFLYRGSTTYCIKPNHKYQHLVMASQNHTHFYFSALHVCLCHNPKRKAGIRHCLANYIEANKVDFIIKSVTELS